MQWVCEELSFRGRPLRVAHYEAPGRGLEEVSDDLSRGLDRCEAELGACLWHDTNDTALRFLERRRPGGYTGVRALELGAGAGVCGLALAVDGAISTLTDVDALVPLMELNIEQNGFSAGAGTSGLGDGGAAKSASAPKPSQRRHAAARRRGRGGDELDSSSFAHAEDEEDEAAEAAEEASGPRRPSAKERRAARAATKLAKKQPQKSAGAGEEEETDPVAPARGSCTAAAAEWRREAQQPALPAGSFDIVIVCDCLYENKESWESLQTILERAPAPGGEVVLASANLRRPFLEEFSERLQRSGFQRVTREDSEHAVIVAFAVPPAATTPAAGECTEAGGCAASEDAN